MKGELAERLLSVVMGWDASNVAEERPVIQMLAEYKYDEYQQYSPGMRFIESLALWLNQFDKSEREPALNFIKDNLVFISLEEMTHLVAISFNDFIKPKLIEKVAKYLEKDPFEQMKEVVSDLNYEISLRRCLFLGLSDGAHIDIFRRYNNSLSNEQICLSYDIPNKKLCELKEELSKDIDESLKNNNKDLQIEKKFNTIVLLDDFTGSGISYLRKEGDEWKGKISKVISEIKNQKNIFSKKIDVFIVLYIATEKAKTYLLEVLQQYKEDFCKETNFTLITVMNLEGINVETEKHSDFLELAKNHFDEIIIDKHFKKGNYKRPFLGFDECALPIVIFHNTPNNTLPIIWFGDKCKVKGLFPRVSRHKEELYEKNT
ncbi:phosphoribosyltransferase-like protein [Acetivibrio cellulolyticus]|uniref:phosphoribosyltransferase-like protein n=1 Tax=Acetivibrio cellulolyticus TaxID=35830 RepID=UPI0001E2F5E5|nr:hypothetical protein [Acetivibrio cellulolyticus]